MRAVGLMLLVSVMLAACSSSSGSVPDVTTDDAKDEAAHRALCADPAWKAAHLGLWYNVCSATRL